MTLDVAHAEYAGGGPGYALVRLRGRARAHAPARLAPPTLLIADGAAWRRLAPVPGTPLLAADAGGAPFAVDFEVPLHLAVGDGAWWLEPGPVLAGGAPPARLDVLAERIAQLGAEIAALRARVDGAAPPATAADSEHRPTSNPAPSAAAVPVSRAARLRALRPGLPALLVAAGALAVGDAVATVAWQEPVSALWAAHQQHALDGDLQRLDAAYDSPAAAAAAGIAASSADPAAVAGAAAPRVLDVAARIRALAGTLERRTTAGRPLGELRIARLHARYVVVQGTSAGSLRRGPGHYLGTALPGESGTVGIAGHRTTYGAPFRHIDALRRGDVITVTMPYGRFVYRVEGMRIVKPADVSALQAIGRQRLVLTACHPLYSAAKRYVVIARLASAAPRGAAALSGIPAPRGDAGAVRTPPA